MEGYTQQCRINYIHDVRLWLAILKSKMQFKLRIHNLTHVLVICISHFLARDRASWGPGVGIIHTWYCLPYDTVHWEIFCWVQNFRGQICFRERKNHKKKEGNWWCHYVHTSSTHVNEVGQSVCPLNGCCGEDSASYCTKYTCTNEIVRDAPKMSHQP